MTSLNFFRHIVKSGLVTALFVCTLGIANANAADRCTVRQAQQALTDQGFEPGPVDGAMGRRTRNALRAFQKANELPASGRLNRDTCRQLTSPPATEPNKESSATPTPAQPAESSETAQPAPAPEAPSAESQTQTGETNTAAPETAPPAAAESSAQPASSPAAAPEPSYKRITNPVALYRTAFGLHKSRSYHVAVSAFEHYLRTFGDHDRVADALYWLSEGYLELGMEEQARDSLEQFMAAFPGHRYAPKARGRLNGISPVGQ